MKRDTPVSVGFVFIGSAFYMQSMAHEAPFHSVVYSL